MTAACELPAPVLHDIVVGRSPRMRAVFDYIAHIGPGEGTVLITGESGTGKEVIARAIHAHSPRRNGPFVAVSCALFADTLIESELFGHERGAFTGATHSRPGRFERAEGGTIFLDDIDDVPLAMQVKLLRVLQNRCIERLGGTRSIPVNVRVLAGSKRPLKQMAEVGEFREDLYYRLNVISVDLPPLRERLEDLPLLARHFLDRFFARRGRPTPPISDAVIQAFLAYDWPGNVRELENACERIAESASCGRVGIGCVAPSVLFHAPVVPVAETAPEPAARVEEAPPPPAPLPDPSPWTSGPFSLDDHLRHEEARLIARALADSRGNKSRAARLLGIKRSTLGDRIERLKASGIHAEGAGSAA
ncbi:MAG TPA: sigma-54 dependent transcriptional regulator [Vicinamibacterales bacterium]